MDANQNVTADDSLRLRHLIALEESAIRTYTATIPYIDTPELASMIEKIRQDHIERRGALCAALAMGFDDSCMDLTTFEGEQIAVLGDTAETVIAIEKLFDVEQRVETAWKDLDLMKATSPDLHALIESHVVYEETDFAKVRDILTSVRAAARLLGPGDQPPILHH